ncbi:Similar to Protein TOS1; acc. no. P38288 [Pyronema omphalodes CBS 100304]|uniref:glucan endo-1,3-beta-D-glucosidase n=1 Tax=Pyronema omphalodes (strain CBS 100304) TaxID=1076935 RepID=U4LN65_PYROM|nr:Similar to Protein TOS1; acc. no. P38288 [Pyronema omphalodes CBS 100304]
MMSVFKLLSAGLIATAYLADTANAQCKTINNVPYCKEVDHIMYTNIGGSGKYDDVVFMDGKTCQCDKKPKTFSGSMAPLDEELSLHFRGPLKLKQLAVYMPGGRSKRDEYERDEYGDAREHMAHSHGAGHHGHGAERHMHQNQARAGGMSRIGYYNAGSKTSQGLTFLNHKGGKGSGVFDHCWGNSLSYMSSDCSDGASSPQVLNDMTIQSRTEFIVMSDRKCSGSDCGYYLNGIPAYHGFGGKSKVFLFEFQMPHDPTTGFNGNMPSIWALNAKIPRTAQYGACSCWTSGCGEIDLFEVLDGATDYVKSHYHASQGAAANGGKGGGGSPDYFKRPFDKVVKAAAIFDASGSVTIKLLPDSTSFGSSIDTGSLMSGEPAVYKVPS